MNSGGIMNKDDWYREEFFKASESIQNKKQLSLCDFHRIRNFKIQASSRENEEEIIKVTNKAFQLAHEDNDKTKEAIDELCKLHGVGIPIASTILAMKYPDRYAIIDKNVIKGLDKENEWKAYQTDSSVYEEYVKIMREKLNNENPKTLRELELELFFKGKEKN